MSPPFLIVGDPPHGIRAVRRSENDLINTRQYSWGVLMLYRENKIGALGLVKALNHELCSPSYQPIVYAGCRPDTDTWS
jgi:hypothetical protein